MKSTVLRAVTALPVAVARDLPLEKQCEFRVASGAVIPNVGKMKMKSTDEESYEKGQGARVRSCQERLGDGIVRGRLGCRLPETELGSDRLA